MLPKIIAYKENIPQIDDSSYLADNTIIIGKVTVGVNTNIWPNTVIRGDVAEINIGDNTNIQDGTIIHVSRDEGHTNIGNNVTIGHCVLLHACKLHDYSFVGMRATIMDGAVVESYGWLAAGSLLTPNKIVKSGEIWAGNPAKFFRYLTNEEKKYIEESAQNYVLLAKDYKLA